MDFEKIKNNLERRRFTVSCFKTAEQACAYFVEKIKGETVAFGGSVTLREMGLYGLLSKNNTVFWHWVNPADRQRQNESTVYITSANAVAETGEIVNIDGAGNRVSRSVYGAKKVYFVLGSNKICATLDAALERARNVAAPLNAARLNAGTPCVADGKCHDCVSPERICGVTAVHMAPMRGVEHTEVVLIDAKLGY
jgi:L-lactate utilization protein LutC